MSLECSKKIMLDILLEFDRLCKKHSLIYWLDYGTLLGAVRHKGFIPWDDDIDVSMPREDYEKFLKLEDIPNELFLQTKRSDTNSPVHYAKLRDRDSTYVDAWEENRTIEYHQGIFIDIYPINFIKPSNIFIYKVILRFSKLFANRYIKIDFIAERFISFLNHFHSLDNSLAVLGAEGMVYDLQIYKKDLFPLENIEFEGYSFSVPKDTDRHLSKLYGDYMRLPDISDQKVHSVNIFPNEKCNYELKRNLE